MKEVVILAGGLGTRLRNSVEEQPKVLAPIDGKPFLEFLLDYLEDQWVDHVILALGYKSEQVTQWLKNKAYTFKISTSLEQEPLGTGGAIKRALMKCHSQSILIINGDTFFPIDLNTLWDAPQQSPITIALTNIQEASRYGQVVLNEDHYITQFLEKNEDAQNKNILINAGVYKIIPSSLPFDEWGHAFSWEKEVLEPLSQDFKIKGIIFDQPFIDIGIPEDYHLAQTLIPSLVS